MGKLALGLESGSQGPRVSLGGMVVNGESTLPGVIYFRGIGSR